MKVHPFLFLCRWLCVSFLVLGIRSALSQNLKCKIVSSGKWVKLDTILIDANSIKTNVNFTFNPKNQQIFITPDKKEFEVCYKTVSSFLTKSYYNRNINSYDAHFNYQDFQQPKSIEKESIFEFGGDVEKFGAISRGISFGNRQNLVVNSIFNLQIEGKLTENLSISAVITDQNIPYQPEGNTQQIRDFDNVFISLYNQKFSLTAGDIILRNDSSNYFLKYYKNIQGLEVQNTWNHGKFKTKLKASGAFSKGKFHSAIIEPIDGVSGPYKLRGADGSRFIIILANSEKVYLNGEKLERGFENDYQIDYNLGEIRFNNHVLITQFSVIRVDYEYAEQRYSRSNLSLLHKTFSKKSVIYSTIYREKDNPNNVFGLNLSPKSLADLAMVGDTIKNAFVIDFDTVKFASNQVLYEKIDSVFLGAKYSIFRYTKEKNKTYYRPIFNKVGENKGNYRLKSSTINGNVFEWLAPENGIAQGNYEVGAFVPPPNSKTLAIIGGKFQLSDYEVLNQEIAFSNLDKNLYSKLQDNDNKGVSFYGNFQSKGRPSFIKGYQWNTGVSAEWNHQNFSFIDRFRPILFDRGWGISEDSVQQKGRNTIFSSVIGISKNLNNLVNFSLNLRDIKNQFLGKRYRFNLNKNIGKLYLHSKHSFLDADELKVKNQWFKSKSTVSYRSLWNKISSGYSYEVDKHQEYNQNDSVFFSQMHYELHRFFLANSDSSKSKFHIFYDIRNDDKPIEGKIKGYLFSNTINAHYDRNIKNGFLKLDANYRIQNNKLTLKKEEFVNGSLNWKSFFLKNHITNQIIYGTGNARELKRTFIFLQVNAGEGTHTWRDENGDGIQDLNEFYEAINPDEKNYVKIFTPTDEYITVFNTNYIHNLSVKAPIKWRKQVGFKKLISKLSLNISQNTRFSTISNFLKDRLNPYFLNINDNQTKSINEQFRGTLYFNKNRRGLAFDFSKIIVRKKQLLSQGSSQGLTDAWNGNLKIDFSAAHTFRLIGNYSKVYNASSFLMDRNYTLIKKSINPIFIWLVTPFFRLNTGYKYSNNLTLTQRYAISQKMNMEITYQNKNQGTIKCQYNLEHISSNNSENDYLTYLLFNGLQAGINHSWNIFWQKKLTKGLQINLNYFGRKSKKISVVHNGSVSLTAYF